MRTIVPSISVWHLFAIGLQVNSSMTHRINTLQQTISSSPYMSIIPVHGFNCNLQCLTTHYTTELNNNEQIESMSIRVDYKVTLVLEQLIAQCHPVGPVCRVQAAQECSCFQLLRSCMVLVNPDRLHLVLRSHISENKINCNSS